MGEEPGVVTHLGDILVVDDTADSLRLLTEMLSSAGYKARATRNPEMAIEAAQITPPDLILLDVKMPEIDGYEVCRRLRADERTDSIPIIFVSALMEVEDRIRGFAAGGVDYITKPFQESEVLARVRTHIQLSSMQSHLEHLVSERTAELAEANEALQREVAERMKAEKELRHLEEQLRKDNVYLREEIQLEHNFEEIIGNSEALRYVLFQVEKVAPTDSSVLLLGETGTGKELIARAVHDRSRRRDRPLIKVNCAALPTQLIESELFGHEKGSFTGADARRVGRFELADGATLFLDEISEIPLEVQPKLLRVLEEGEFERVGSSNTIKTDTRLIAATNRDLSAEILAGRFRQDLFYRLDSYSLTAPPLRERIEDIPLLVDAFIAVHCKRVGKQVEHVSHETMDALSTYSWPGNVRELQNVIGKAVIVMQDRTLRVELPDSHPAASHGDLTQTLDEVERGYILQVLKRRKWRIEGPSGAARSLGLNAGTLRSRMKKLGIERPT